MKNYQPQLLGQYPWQSFSTAPGERALQKIYRRADYALEKLPITRIRQA